MKTNKISEGMLGARSDARGKWLKEHPEFSMTDFGHAHGLIGMLEAGVAEGWGDEHKLRWGERDLLERYEVDVTKLPE